MTALSWILWGSDTQTRRQCLTARGKPQNVAMVAVMRPPARLLDSLLRGDRLWQAELPRPAVCRMSPSTHGTGTQLAVRLEPSEDRLPQAPLSGSLLDSAHGSRRD